MTRPVALFSALCRWFAGLLSVVMVMALTTMFVSVGVQVIARGVFSTSVLWFEDVLMSCFTISIFSGIALAFRTRSHLATTVLSDSLPAGLAWGLGKLIDLICILAMAGLGWFGIEFTQSAFGQFTPVLWLPLGWVYLIIPVSAGLSILFILDNQLSESGVVR